MILNLDSNFSPLGTNTVKYASFIFSGGEPHVKIESDLMLVREVTITTRIKSFNDFGILLCAVDALKRMGIEKINVFMPYFPGARQDRIMVPGEALTVKIYADILNNLNLNSIKIYDPHSEVTPAVLNNCEVLNNHQFIKKVMGKIDREVLLISPDGGALKKIYQVSEALGGIAVIECSKRRNTRSGELAGFKVYEEDLKGKDCLIVDDICDGGGTFIGLAKELKKKNAGELYLAVSHGIFSKGIEELKMYYTQLFTTDSFNTVNEVVQIAIKEIVKK